jgi:hypothetical protein
MLLLLKLLVVMMTATMLMMTSILSQSLFEPLKAATHQCRGHDGVEEDGERLVGRRVEQQQRHQQQVVPRDQRQDLAS